jgi:hypothetical protein
MTKIQSRAAVHLVSLGMARVARTLADLMPHSATKTSAASATSLV